MTLPEVDVNSEPMAVQVQSIPSVTADEIYSSTEREEPEFNYQVTPSIEDFSTAIIKETFVRALSQRILEEHSQFIGNAVKTAMSDIIVTSDASQLSMDLSQSRIPPTAFNTPTTDPYNPDPCCSTSATIDVDSTYCGDSKTPTLIVESVSDSDNRDPSPPGSSMSAPAAIPDESGTNVKESSSTVPASHSENGCWNQQSASISIQNLGQAMMEEAISRDKVRPSPPLFSDLPTSPQCEFCISYKSELEKVRPNSDSVTLLCNQLDIDPAIATVEHLLQMLTLSQDHNTALQNQVKDLSDKLNHMTNSVAEQKETNTELTARIRSLEAAVVERLEGSVTEIMQHFQDLLEEIKRELEERPRAMRLDEEFWLSKYTSMERRVTIALDQQKESDIELRRKVSNAGTDKWSEGEVMEIPVEGFRGDPTAAKPPEGPLFEDDDHGIRDSGKTKTCAIQ